MADDISPKSLQTIKVILEECRKLGYGELTLKLIVHDKDLVGFEQEKPPMIKFRVKGEGK